MHVLSSPTMLHSPSGIHNMNLNNFEAIIIIRIIDVIDVDV